MWWGEVRVTYRHANFDLPQTPGVSLTKHFFYVLIIFWLSGGFPSQFINNINWNKQIRNESKHKLFINWGIFQLQPSNWSLSAGAFIFQYIEEPENMTESFIVSIRTKTVMRLWNITERWVGWSDFRVWSSQTWVNILPRNPSISPRGLSLKRQHFLMILSLSFSEFH